mgnify:CR=1 FL=1
MFHECARLYNGYDQRSGQSCCMMKSSKHYLFTPDGWWKSEDYTTSKAQMEKGEFPDACDFCWRSIKNDKVGSTIFRPYNDWPEGIEKNKLAILTLYVGNKCNLACRTCGAVSSTGWTKEHKKTVSRFTSLRKDLHLQPSMGFIQKWKDNIDVDISNLRVLEVLGGEPFYETEHLEFVDRLLLEADPSQIEIFYSTNGTKALDKEIYDRLKYFKKVIINFSIDAVGKPFEYIRTLGDWKQVDSNLKTWLSKCYGDYKYGLSVHIHPTLSVLNICYLDELYDYMQDNNMHETGFSPVIHPTWYSWNVLKHHQKEKISVPQHSKHSAEWNHMLANHKYNGHRHKFHEAIQATYEFRGLDIQNYLPDLCQLMEIDKYYYNESITN